MSFPPLDSPASHVMQMPTWDEHTFTEEEWIAAFAIILPPEQAREEGLAWQAADVPGPRSYDGDLLDLLSLVSDSCAERAWTLMGISRDEGERRQAEFRRRVEEAIRARDEG